MQWLRGWVSEHVVRDEFTNLRNHNSSTTTVCTSCTEHAMPCQHSKSSKFYDKILQLRHKHVLKPFILVALLYFTMEVSVTMLWRPYVIQVIKAYGIPLDANLMATILSGCSIAGNCCFLLGVGVFGKRRLYLISGVLTVLCCTALSTYLASIRLNFFRKLFCHHKNLTFQFNSRHLWLRSTPTKLDIVQ